MSNTIHKTLSMVSVAAALGVAPCATSAAPSQQKQYSPATITCVISAAQAYKIPPALMLAVASVEGGKNGTASRNTNGTYDLGHFQLNSAHWKEGGFFSKYDMERARWDGCLNALMASRLMRWQFDNRSSRDWWTVAASYHSTTPQHNRRYRKLLIAKTREWESWLGKVNAACSKRSDKTKPCQVYVAKRTAAKKR